MAEIETNTEQEKSLFIIEDDKPFRERLTTSFQRKDFSVTAAASKKEALDILTNNDFNYAIVDLRLGDGSGLDVIKVIKEKNRSSVRVALSLSDSFCVERHFEAFRELTRDAVDIIFANEDEMMMLTRTETVENMIEASKKL